MQMTVEKYQSTGVPDGKGGFQITEEHKVGKTETLEFGGPDDNITAAVGGGYTRQWRPDFLQLSLGKTHSFSRFYFDKRIAVDIEDPSSHTAKKKRKLLFANGFGYLCIPPDFPKDYNQVKALYNAALREYEAYEQLHPRPETFQEITLPADGDIPARKVKVRSIDFKVGGGMTISPEQQPTQAVSLTETEQAVAREQARITKAIRDCAKRGQPFRNPFIKKGGIRLYNVHYPGGSPLVK